MAKKKKAPDAGPSKAYLVSFGDTMTALLAFFIVLNSLATEQTGANLYNGTGSFASAFAKSGTAGNKPSNRSEDMIQQSAPSPIYALPQNLNKNPTEDGKGPDDTESTQRVIDRDKEEFQKFLSQMDQEFGLDTQPAITKQVVFDSFVPFDRKDGSLSKHALQLASEVIPQLRKNSGNSLEIIVWPPMPGKNSLDRTLSKTVKVRRELENGFWLKPEEKSRVRYSVKPWLFSDAKRPIISFVLSERAK